MSFMQKLIKELDREGNLPVVKEVSGFLKREEEMQLERKHFIDYLFYGNISLNSKEKVRLAELELQRLPFSKSYIDGYVDLNERIILNPFERYISRLQKSFMLNLARESVSKCENRIVYLRSHLVAAALLTHVYKVNPLTKKPSFHIGFLGYDRQSIDKISAQSIKQDMLDSIEMWNIEGLPVTAWVFSFNIRSRKFFLKLGLQPAWIRISRKL